MKTVQFTEFRRKASEYLTDVEHGETIIVMRHGKAIAEIAPPKALMNREPAWRYPVEKVRLGGKSLSEIILEERS